MSLKKRFNYPSKNSTFQKMSFCYLFCHPFAIRLLSFRSPFWVFTFVFKKPIKFTKHSQRWGFSWVVEQWVKVLITRIDQLCKQLKFHDYINNNLNELKYQISQVIHFFLDEQQCVNICLVEWNSIWNIASTR